MDFLLNVLLLLPVCAGAIVAWEAPLTWWPNLLGVGLIWIGVMLINEFWVTF